MKERINCLDVYKKRIEQFENTNEIFEIFNEYDELNKNSKVILKSYNNVRINTLLQNR